MPKLSRAAAIVPLVGVTMAASALAGAAVYTVAQTGCSEAGQYVQHGQQIELVGGCVDRDDLPSGVHRAPHESGSVPGKSLRRG